MNIAFYKGTERNRTLQVYDNDIFHSQITSSGSTHGYEKFALDSDETADLTLCLDDSAPNSEWLSITEVCTRRQQAVWVHCSSLIISVVVQFSDT